MPNQHASGDNVSAVQLLEAGQPQRTSSEQDVERGGLTAPAPQTLGDLPVWGQVWLFLVLVLVWRSMWNLVDIYVFPDQPQVSNWVSLLLGIIGLVCLRQAFPRIPLHQWVY